MIILADTKVCIKFCLYKPVLFVELTSHILVFYTVSLPQSFEYSITSPPPIHCLFRSWALVHRLIVLYCLAQKLQNIYRIIGCHGPSSLASGLYRTHFFTHGLLDRPKFKNDFWIDEHQKLEMFEMNFYWSPTWENVFKIEKVLKIQFLAFEGGSHNNKWQSWPTSRKKTSSLEQEAPDEDVVAQEVRIAFALEAEALVG